MKKFFLSMMVFGIAMTAIANDGASDVNKAVASEAEQATYCTVIIEFQTNPLWDMGSTVTYDGPSGQVTQNLRVISNFLTVRSGSPMFIQLLVDPGTIVKGYATDYGEFYDAPPTTREFYYGIASDRNIIIRVERAEE